MALVEVMPAKRAVSWLSAGLGFACVAVGCMLTGRGGDGALAFSHEVHVVDELLDCVTCHEDLAVSDSPGMPALDTCMFCHDEIDDGVRPERRVETLFNEDEVFRATLASAVGGDVIFAHLQHVEALGQDCDACHEGIEENERIGPGIGPLMDDCMACHSAREAPNECATCHDVIRADSAPGSHHQNWTMQHGKVYRAAPEGQQNNCFLCHSEPNCVRCHMLEPPKNHNEFWRLRGHPIVARLDRNNCATCHQPTMCDACHRDVLPINHTGLWGGTTSMHCLTCHFPLPANGCATCHRDTMSHLLATPKPAWHTPAMNCTGCHGVSVPLPHVNKGDNCNICHF